MRAKISGHGNGAMRYVQVTDGEWVQPIRKGYRVTCCDCGLVHRINIRVRKGKVQFQAFRDNRATARRRKRNGNRDG